MNAAMTRPQSGSRSRQPGHGHGDENRRAHEVGGDEDAPSIPAVGDEAAVQPEDERRDAVREAHREHAERPAGLEGEPHQGDVLERVAELARRYRDVHAPEVAPAQERERPARRRERVDARLFGRTGDRIGHEV